MSTHIRGRVSREFNDWGWTVRNTATGDVVASGSEGSLPMATDACVHAVACIRGAWSYLRRKPKSLRRSQNGAVAP